MTVRLLNKDGEPYGGIVKKTVYKVLYQRPLEKHIYGMSSFDYYNTLEEALLRVKVLEYDDYVAIGIVEFTEE